jgi:mannan endo-1,4-beta-mannosidase
MKNCIYAFLLVICILPRIVWSQGFRVNGTQLLDANGTNFIMKGINIPLAWFISDVNNNIDNMKRITNANCFRIVMQLDTPDVIWQTCVKKCIDNKIIPMVELHDVTGSNNVNDLQRMTNFWISKAAYLKRPDIARYILINVANEWGDWAMSHPAADPSATVWRDAYSDAVKLLRQANITTTIVVDAPGYGQDEKANVILNYAKDVQANDPLHNVLFSIHMYCEWSPIGGSDPATLIPAIKNAGIPLIVGEFGDHMRPPSGSCNIDVVKIMRTCQTYDIGWLAWVWKVNNFLDLSNDWAGNSLTNWGQTVINGAYGTKNAVTASVFPETAGCGTWNGFPICCSAASDPDRDGYGWENEQTCLVFYDKNCGILNGFPICCSSTSDPDGDGFGWENHQTCIVNKN